MKAPVTYESRFIAQPEFVFPQLWHNLPWEKRDDAPRRECWFNPYGEPYTYGSGDYARTYEAHPLDYKNTPAMLLYGIMRQLNEFFDAKFDCCFVNGYDHGRQHLGWHSDDSPEMDLDHPIATVSLGAKREIWFRKRRDAGWGSNWLDDKDITFDPEKLMLENGSAAIMGAGMQRDWQHRIPKDPKGENCGPRISLTYRRLVR